MNRLCRRVAILLLAVAPLATFGASCAAPPLPLPPPTALVGGPPDADGNVTITGMARDDAFVAGVNNRLEVGTIVRADELGNYTLILPAASGDSVNVFQFQEDGTTGINRTVLVP